LKPLFPGQALAINLLQLTLGNLDCAFGILATEAKIRERDRPTPKEASCQRAAGLYISVRGWGVGVY
jgi:hypothetical protein